MFIACRSQARGSAPPSMKFAPPPTPRRSSCCRSTWGLASVRRCAEAFLARDLPLHLLINNAGLAGAASLRRVSNWRLAPITWATFC